MALPPSTGRWECHHSTEGFRTRLGAHWASMSLQEIHLNNSHTNPHVYTQGSLIPLLSREGKKGICINPRRWRYTETWDGQATDVTHCSTQFAQPPRSGNSALALPHTSLTAARWKASSHRQKLYTLPIANNTLQGTSITQRA